MKAIITIGVPGSGKSHWAKQQKNYVEINKDDIRFEYIVGNPNGLWHEYKYNTENEDKVEFHFNNKINKCWYLKQNIIISNTNIDDKKREKLIKHLTSYGYQVEIKIFDVPFETCIKNDINRHRSVGYSTIAKHYEKFIKFKIKHMNHYIYSHQPNLPNCWIFDIDGTLAHMNGRGPYDKTMMGYDTVDESVKMIHSFCSKNDDKIIIMSGRDNTTSLITTSWLRNYGIKYDMLLLRGQQSKEEVPDQKLKIQLFNEHIKDKYNVLGIFEDRPKVCRMWRDHGFTVFQLGNPYIEF